MNSGRLRRVTPAAHLPSTARARPHSSRLGPSARRAVGAPLKAVEKVVTSRFMALWPSDGPKGSRMVKESAEC